MGKRDSLLLKPGERAMNPKSDPRVRFEPGLALRTVASESLRRSWLPALIPADYAIAPTYWLTRASRGISWHRAGRATSRDKCR